MRVTNSRRKPPKPASAWRANELPPTATPMTEEQILFCLELAELCDGMAVLSV